MNRIATNRIIGEKHLSATLPVTEPLPVIFLNFAKLQGTLAAFGVILAAVYMLSVVQKMFFGPLKNPKNKNLSDINMRETIAVAPMLVMVFVIGFFPRIFLDVRDIEPEEIVQSIVLIEDAFIQHLIPYEFYLVEGFHNEESWGAYVERYMRFYTLNW